jgi:hypothetical protein
MREELVHFQNKPDMFRGIAGVYLGGMVIYHEAMRRRCLRTISGGCDATKTQLVG